MSALGRAATQMRFSDCPREFQPRFNLEEVPFVGKVSGVTPGMMKREPEVRRTDVGTQSYGSSTATAEKSGTDRHGLPLKAAEHVTYFKTSHGEVGLSENRKPDLGFLPTADVVDFLRSQYVGSRQPDPPARYFTK